MNKIEQHLHSGQAALNMMQFIMKNSKDTEHKNVIIDKEVWKMIKSQITIIEKGVSRNEQTINHLKSQIHEISSFNANHQYPTQPKQQPPSHQHPQPQQPHIHIPTPIPRKFQNNNSDTDFKTASPDTNDFIHGHKNVCYPSIYGKDDEYSNFNFDRSANYDPELCALNEMSDDESEPQETTMTISPIPSHSENEYIRIQNRSNSNYNGYDLKMYHQYKEYNEHTKQQCMSMWSISEMEIDQCRQSQRDDHESIISDYHLDQFPLEAPYVLRNNSMGFDYVPMRNIDHLDKHSTSSGYGPTQIVFQMKY